MGCLRWIQWHMLWLESGSYGITWERHEEIFDGSYVRELGWNEPKLSISSTLHLSLTLQAYNDLLISYDSQVFH